MAPTPWRACSIDGFSSGLRPTESWSVSLSSQMEIGSSESLFSERSSAAAPCSWPMFGRQRADEVLVHVERLERRQQAEGGRQAR